MVRAILLCLLTAMANGAIISDTSDNSKDSLTWCCGILNAYSDFVPEKTWGSWVGDKNRYIRVEWDFRKCNHMVGGSKGIHCGDVENSRSGQERALSSESKENLVDVDDQKSGICDALKTKISSLEKENIELREKVTQLMAQNKDDVTTDATATSSTKKITTSDIPEIAESVNDIEPVETSSSSENIDKATSEKPSTISSSTSQTTEQTVSSTTDTQKQAVSSIEIASSTLNNDVLSTSTDNVVSSTVVISSTTSQATDQTVSSTTDTQDQAISSTEIASSTVNNDVLSTSSDNVVSSTVAISLTTSQATEQTISSTPDTLEPTIASAKIASSTTQNKNEVVTEGDNVASSITPSTPESTTSKPTTTSLVTDESKAINNQPLETSSSSTPVEENEINKDTDIGDGSIVEDSLEEVEGSGSTSKEA